MPLKKERTAVKMMLYLAFMCIPFVITGIPMKLIDSSWSGTITAIEVVESIGVYTSGGSKGHPYVKNDLVLTIRKDNGKVIQTTDLSLGIKYFPWDQIPNLGKIEHHISRYQIGDRIYKFYGFKYLYILPSGETDTKQCIVCGSMNQSKDRSCWNCKSELIR